MEEVKNEVWERLLGYQPNKELKVLIFAEMASDKITLAEACGRYAMPPMLFGNGPAGDYENEFRPPIQIPSTND